MYSIILLYGFSFNIVRLLRMKGERVLEIEAKFAISNTEQRSQRNTNLNQRNINSRGDFVRYLSSAISSTVDRSERRESSYFVLIEDVEPKPISLLVEM